MVVALKTRKRLKIGITAQATTDTVNTLWSNGIGQNIGYLALMFNRMDIVDSVYVVSCPDSATHPFGSMFGLPVVTMDYAASNLDIIIELGIRAALPHHRDIMRKRGSKLVTYIAGNTFVMDLEHLARNAGFGDYVNYQNWDAAWITPQNWHTNNGYIKLTRANITSVAPHIWDPICLNMTAFETKKNPYYRKPENNSWVLGCFDPNINVYKTFHLSLLAAENAYRKRPDLLARILLFNAKQFKETDHLNSMINALDIGQDKKIFVEIRHRLVDVMGPFVQGVISHQWQNYQNYLYWEVLYLGWPLIHNSTFFKDVGYYFPEFDPITGGDVIVDALANHDEYRIKQADAIRETLWGLSIENPAVQNRYADLIEEVMG